MFQSNVKFIFNEIYVLNDANSAYEIDKNSDYLKDSMINSVVVQEVTNKEQELWNAEKYSCNEEERKKLNYPLHSKSCHYLGRPDDSPINFILLDVRERTIITRPDVIFAHDHKFKEPREWHPGEKGHTLLLL